MANKEKLTKAATNATWAAVKVGRVTVDVRTPTPVELRKRVNESRWVATRLGSAIEKPGVSLSHKATTPVFTADAKDPNLVVRKVGKTLSRGRFKNGVFVVVA